MAFRNRITRLSQLVADTVTGAVIATAQDGARIVLEQIASKGWLEFYSGDPNENANGYITAGTSGAGALTKWVLTLRSGTMNAIANTYSVITIASGSVTNGVKRSIQFTSDQFWFVGSGAQTLIDGDVLAENFAKAGTLSSGVMVAATDKTVAVLFTDPFPDANYMVATNVNENAIGTAAPKAQVTSKTQTGFNVVFRREAGTAAITMNWIAIRTTAS